MRHEAITLVAAPLRKRVIELLRDAIVSFEFEPGERLVERDLCERFGVSRTVIREALRHLEAEGLVELVANRGPIVSATTPEQAQGLYEVREVLESLAARCCAERSTPAQKEALGEALTLVADAYSNGTLSEQLHAKDVFYRVLCEGSGNPVIASSLRSINARVQVLRGLSLGAPGRIPDSIAELTQVVAAIDEGDGERAEKLATQHVRNAASTALARLRDETKDQA